MSDKNLEQIQKWYKIFKIKVMVVKLFAIKIFEKKKKLNSINKLDYTFQLNIQKDVF